MPNYDYGERALLKLTFLLIAIPIRTLLGALCSNYCLWFILNKDIPWYGDIVVATFANEVIMPATILCWVLSLFGVQPPLIH